MIGTDEVKDKVVIGITLMMLNASLRTKRYLDMIQWDMTRKTPTLSTNEFETGEACREGAIYSSNDRKVCESSAPTTSQWFPIFMLGVKRRMGIVRKQDEALTVDQLMAICEITKVDWNKSKSEEEQTEIELVISCMIVGLYISLWGE